MNVYAILIFIVAFGIAVTNLSGYADTSVLTTSEGEPLNYSDTDEGIGYIENLGDMNSDNPFLQNWFIPLIIIIVAIVILIWIRGGI